MAKIVKQFLARAGKFADKHIAPLVNKAEVKSGLKFGALSWEMGAIALGLLAFLLWNAVFKMDLVQSSNVYFSYLLSFVMSQRQMWYVWPIALVIATTLLVRKSFPKKINKANRIGTLKLVLAGAITTLALSAVVINAGFGLTYVAGTLHANSLLAGINKGTNSEVIWGKDKIQSRLESLDKAPVIVESSKESLRKDLISVSLGNSNLGSYYTREVIAKIPNSVLIATNVPSDSFLMVRDNLIVIEIKDDQIQQISPVLGYKLVKSYFGSRYIKSYPEIKVLGRQDYLKFREDQINKRIKAIEEVLVDVKKELGVANNNVAVARNRVASYTSALSYADYAREQTYQYCVELGAYYSYYTPSYCRTYVDSYWNSQIAKYQQELRNAQANLASWQREAAYWADINKFVSEVKVIVESQKDIAPYELGVFHDENKIEIALDETNSKSIYPYSATLVHEYMHYTSHVSQERTLPLFFEEALTEYYARKIYQGNLGKESNLGYPVLVKLIEEMHKKIDPKKFEEIYFNKDKKALEAALDEAYGKGFFEKNSLKFEILPLMGGEEQVKAANEIMEKIGGEKLNPEDFKVN